MEADYTGQIRATFVPYFDHDSRTTKFKSRPVLFINITENQHNPDYTALPVSKISRKGRIDPYYDNKIKLEDYPDCGLDCEVSYIRSHKIMTVTQNHIDKADLICDFRKKYPDEYELIISRTKEYINSIQA